MKRVEPLRGTTRTALAGPLRSLSGCSADLQHQRAGSRRDAAPIVPNRREPLGAWAPLAVPPFRLAAGRPTPAMHVHSGLLVLGAAGGQAARAQVVSGRAGLQVMLTGREHRLTTHPSVVAGGTGARLCTARPAGPGGSSRRALSSGLLAVSWSSTGRAGAGRQERLPGFHGWPSIRRPGAEVRVGASS